MNHETKDIFITFFGNREIYDERKVVEKLTRVLESVFFDYGLQLTERLMFYCGGSGAFDGLALRVINALQRKYPSVSTKKYFITPFVTPSYLRNFEIVNSDKIYDDIIYPPLETVPPKFAIEQRNKWLIDQCEYVFIQGKYSCGDIGELAAYAESRCKTIVYL